MNPFDSVQDTDASDKDKLRICVTMTYEYSIMNDSQESI